jgi:glucose-6-phosphate 1-epimerase
MSSLLLSSLAICTQAQAQAQQPSAPTIPASLVGDPTSAQLQTYRVCLDTLRTRAAAAGVEGAHFDRNMATITPDMSVLPLLDAQPEFTTPIWDYLAALVDEERVEDGRAMLREHAAVLTRIGTQYGVDPETVVAVWGVESDYGQTFGKRPLLQSLATLSCFGRRQDFFRGELFATLGLLQAGDLRDSGLTGSWAGAFGHTQFMPSTYKRIAVDFDGDGRRDLVGSIPDALASTANYLRKSSWRSGQPWGFEVRLPAGYKPPMTGRKATRPLSAWVNDGLVRADGAAIAGSDDKAGLLLPAGRNAPAFIVFRNFNAIYSYNAAESYALAIALLSDRLRGGSGMVAQWPTDDPGLSRAQRRELQTLLLARGHDIGEVDGMIGSKSRVAIQQEKRRLGIMPADGRAGRKLLDALQAQP